MRDVKMTIRCSRCGCAKFFFTRPDKENKVASTHHGACCAGCGKALNLSDLISLATAKSFAATLADQ